ncbi:AEC family transporter [uncultured Thomasclavelia sp.]|uniref:AEC family transporter n=1 Tax=uncultured Thomasclavelia sp. TaxID=3025759 RepID=UPI0025DEBD7F|nr:AEC family transporter [uncultured Thomasclavelia sp.]
MNALATLFPVFFMVALGLIARIRGWITSEQKDGTNHIIFNILFPFLIFNIILTSTIEASSIWIVLYVFVVFIIAVLVGKVINKLVNHKYSHISPYMLTTCEGGNVALPLYLSIVGSSSNTVIFDLAGTLMCFVIIPVIVAKISAGKVSFKQLVKKIFSNSFVIAVILAMILNFSGVYNFLATSQFIDIYTNTIEMVTGPIVGMILFIIGYNLNINKETLNVIIKMITVRVLFYFLVILGFFIIFPELMADEIYLMAVLIYFMSPTGFALPMQISPLYQNEDDASFTSAFISLNMIITLIVYVFVVIFIA